MNTNSLISEIMVEGNKEIIPTVGMGVTVCYGSDRVAGTIVSVSKSGKKIEVQLDDAKRFDKNGMSESQEYVYNCNILAPIHSYTKRKNGRWIHEGDSIKGIPVILGVRDHYYDFNF